MGDLSKQIYRQFGVAPAKENNRRTVDDFRKDCLRELKKIRAAWPDLNYATAKGVLILHPSTTVIPRRHSSFNLWNNLKIRSSARSSAARKRRVGPSERASRICSKTPKRRIQSRR